MSSDHGPTVLKTKREEAGEHNANYREQQRMSELRKDHLSIRRAIDHYLNGIKDKQVLQQEEVA